ncbi:MAG: helix-turn-helix domain-containing protein [Treponema sp.]|nr:helix-turn-helix domain-containing protein [Treponema sp.]
MGSTFRQNLKDELSFQGMTVKELSGKTGIPKPTLDCYLSSRQTMPPADAAVRIAQVLKVSVEFLVTGGETKKTVTLLNELKYKSVKDILADLLKLNENTLSYIRPMIHAAVEAQEGKSAAQKRNAVFRTNKDKIDD